MKKDFNTEEIREKIISTLGSKKEVEVLSRRFGIDRKKIETLESIGKVFGVTRERIRQIEKSIFKKLGKAPSLDSDFNVLEGKVKENGGIITILRLEKLLEVEGSNSEAILRIILESSNNLQIIENPQIKESLLLKKFSQFLVSNIITSAENIIKTRGKPVKSNELLGLILKETNSPKEESLDYSGFIKSVLLSTKTIGKTPEGNLGLSKWGIVNPRNTRDKAYIIFKRVKKPLHYRELTKLVRAASFSKKKVSVEAVHNELIRDSRFVLVGRGIYALKEWGYKTGTVADVIESILKEEGKPLHKNEIIEKVLKRRFVKKNTILLNLQEKAQFKRVKRAVYNLKREK